MSIHTEVRRYRETVLEQGKVALEEARKPWYAAVGAGELAYEQLSQLPAEVQGRLRTLQPDGRELDAATVRSAVENAAATYAAQAREAYESLARRGELAVRRLRRSPEVAETFEKAEDVVADAGKAVAAAEEKVTRPGPAVTRTPAVKTAPARKASAKRSPTS